MTAGVDDVNKRAWGNPDVVDLLTRRSGAVDDGEAAVLERVTEEARGRPLLDLGFGGGRTVPLLRALSEDYVGLDYVPELVEAARVRHPGVRLEEGDARDLSRFESGRFALVLFSFNGIDGLVHEDRPLVFREVRRVLEPRGQFAYSTHNLDHGAAGGGLGRRAAEQALRRPLSLVRYLRRLPSVLPTYRRLRAYSAAGAGWAVAPDPAYGFSVVWHYVTLGHALSELREAGFEQVEVYASDGRRVPPGPSEGSTPWFHLLARAPAAPAP